MTEKPYRKNVGIVVFNQNGDLLVGERTQFPGAWQFPQGGMDDGELPIESAKRELWEEAGVPWENCVGETKDWIAYDFPPELKLHGKLAQYKGQIQKWFLVYWNHPASDCSLDHYEREFLSVKFLNWRDVLNQIVEFKKPIYVQLQSEFEPIIKDFLRQLSA